MEAVHELGGWAGWWVTTCVAAALTDDFTAVFDDEWHLTSRGLAAPHVDGSGGGGRWSGIGRLLACSALMGGGGVSSHGGWARQAVGTIWRLCGGGSGVG